MKKETTFKIGEQTHSIIKQHIIQQIDRYTSVKQFCEKSVDNYSAELLPLCSGGKTIRSLVNHLNSIEGINEPFPDGEIQTHLDDEERLERGVHIKLSNKSLGFIEDIRDNSGLRQSDILRICLYKSLYEIAQIPHYSVMRDFEEELLIKSWINIKNGLQSLPSRFYEVVYRRFHVQRDETQLLIECDPRKFKRFAIVYEDEFYRSDCYENTINTHNQRAFTSLENMIEENTQLCFDESFLADELD